MVAYSVIMFSAAVIFLILGVLLYRGKTSLIHDYHQIHIKSSDKRAYGRAFAKAMFCISLTLLVSGGIALFGENNAIIFFSLALLFAGLIASIVWIGKIQKKYNGGIF